MLAYHLALWAWTLHRRGLSPAEALERWDSALYTRIILEGYDPALRAFLPLYPRTVGLLHTLTGGEVPPWVLGFALSTLCLLAFTLWVSRRVEHGDTSPLVPRTAWGQAFLLFSPASFALHSHHTEALFLLLSFAALVSAWDGHPWRAALFAALCVWTRNQGVFVAVASALLVAREPGPWRQRLTRFTGVGAVTGAAFAALLGSQWLATGDALAHVHALRYWDHLGPVSGAVGRLWTERPWGWPGLRNLFAAVWLVGSLALLRRSAALGLYALVSVLVMLLQRDLGNAFRYGAVVFPMLFWWGDWLAGKPAWVRWPVALLVLWLHHKVTHGLAIGRWVY